MDGNFDKKELKRNLSSKVGNDTPVVQEQELFDGSMSKVSSQTEHVKREAFKVIEEESKEIKPSKTQLLDVKEQKMINQSEIKHLTVN